MTPPAAESTEPALSAAPSFAPRAFGIEPGTVRDGSRVGGAAPVVFDGDYLAGRRYLLTLAAEDVTWPMGLDCSVFLRCGFDVFGADADYPSIGLDVVLHEPSPRGSSTSGRLDDLAEGALVAVADDRDGPCPRPFIRLGGVPDLVQQQPLDALAVTRDGLVFVFEIDDDGYPDGFVTGGPPFDYGAVYFFARLDDEGSVASIAPGLVQF
ncbi:hypothetical protein ACPEEZ_05500 [Frigoribacterium sp. 2-23]|uniref:hypothetical protein n=1 Tax=Frigoribacterium sp. 2-23 TaxID=3415006 RepID=UPI003C6FC7AC